MKTPLFIIIEGITINVMYIESYHYSDKDKGTTIEFHGGDIITLNGNYVDHLNQVLNSVVIHKNNEQPIQNLSPESNIDLIC